MLRLLLQPGGLRVSVQAFRTCATAAATAGPDCGQRARRQLDRQ